MVNEIYVQRAIGIRRTYLKLMNSLSSYENKANDITKKLDEALANLEKIKNKIDSSGTSTSLNPSDSLNDILKVIDEVNESGNSLSKLVDPINIEIERLSKEESELYRQIVESHSNLTEDQIVEYIGERLSKEGLK